MNKWLVYLHKNAATGVVFYVGIGSTKKRPGSTDRNSFWRNYVAKHGAPVIEIIRTGLSEEKAKAIEVRLIAKHGHRRNGGTLVNLTSGGDDQPMRHKHVRDKVSRAMKGRKFSEETRRKMSESAKKRSMEPAHASTRKRMAAGWNPMNSWRARQKVSKSHKGLKRDEACRLRNGLTHSKPVTQRTMSGHLIAVHASQRAAAIAMKCTGANIGIAIKGTTAKGFRWTRATLQECAEHLQPIAQ